MNGVNSQILIGNLGRDLKIRSIGGSRSKATFSLATNKTYKNRDGQNVTNTYWHNVVVWDPELVKLAEQYCTTGKQLFVEGESTTRSYQDRNGNTNYVREMKATSLVPIEQLEGGSRTQVGKSFIVGKLAEKPVLTTNAQGESVCTLVFDLKEGTMPVELTGGQARVAADYLEAGRLAHVNYEIVSTSPFKAVGKNLTLLGSRPNREATETKSYAAKPQSGNVMQQGESGNELDDLPF